MKHLKQLPEPGPKFCTSCQLRKPSRGGMYRVFANGTRQRWVCAACQETAARNLEASKQK